MERVDCNLCGSAAYTLVYRMPDAFEVSDEMFDVVECDRCGLGFVNPRPGPDEMGRFYPPRYYHWLETADHEARYTTESMYLPRASDFGSRPKVLDVGCGPGGFLRFMHRRGWDVAGVEPFYPIDAEFPVYRSMLPEADLPAEHHDAVTAWTVFEHVLDPKRCFAQVGKTLKRGGWFAFTVTNFDSISSKRLFQEDVPRHCYFFTRKTVTRYLDEVGMDLVKARFDDDISAISSRGAVNYWFTRYVRRKPFEWEDRPYSFSRYLEENQLPRNMLSTIKFIIAHPVTTLDKVAEPMVDRLQKLLGTYAMVTYVARKR